MQNNPAAVKAIVRQNLDPYIDSQAFTRLVMGTYATNQYSTAAQRAKFEHNFRETLIENYGTAFVKYTNQTYSLRPYKETNSKILWSRLISTTKVKNPCIFPVGG